MTIGDGLILGILQGLTEFIPVSSSGHLVLGQNLLGLQTSPTFDALVNLGTFLALVVYFWRRMREIAKRIITQRDIRLARNLLISAIPVGLLGFFFGGFFEQAIIQQPLTVAIMLTLIGLLMIFIDKLPKFSPVGSADELPGKRAAFVGVAQAIALIPGTSRSGSTMVAGRLAGLSYQQAAEYSFLLSIPVMAGVLAKSMLGHEGREFIAANFGAWLVSNIAAFICGLFAVGFMLRFLAKGNFKIFGYYRLALAAVIFATLIVAL
jgi:undecaprenyl-diphosphatase